MLVFISTVLCLPTFVFQYVLSYVEISYMTYHRMFYWFSFVLFSLSISFKPVFYYFSDDDYCKEMKRFMPCCFKKESVEETFAMNDIDVEQRTQIE
jgi:hypothetical protein